MRGPSDCLGRSVQPERMSGRKRTLAAMMCGNRPPGHDASLSLGIWFGRAGTSLLASPERECKGPLLFGRGFLLSIANPDSGRRRHRAKMLLERVKRCFTRQTATPQVSICMI